MGVGREDSHAGLRGQPPLRDYSTFVSVTSIDGTHCTPSSLRSWWAVITLPPSLMVLAQRVRSPCQIQVPSPAINSCPLIFPWLSKK